MITYHDNARCINFYPENTSWHTCTTCGRPIHRTGPTEQELKAARKLQRANDAKRRREQLAQANAMKLQARLDRQLQRTREAMPLFAHAI